MCSNTPWGTSASTAPIDSGSFQAGMTSAVRISAGYALTSEVRYEKVSFGMTASGVIRRFATAAAAREALLVGRGRILVDPGALPGAVRDTIRATFGADLGA